MMTNRKIVFLAHDPGGCEALYPVYQKLQGQSIFFALGPSARIHPQFASDWQKSKNVLQELAECECLAGLVLGRDWGTDLDVLALAWARKNGIKSIVVLDYWSNYAVSFRDETGKYHWPDAYLVMDDLARQEAIAEGVPPDILHVSGHPGLDKFCSMGEEYSAPDKDVLFLSQPLSKLYGNSLGYTEQGVLTDVQRACLACGRRLEVKFHPKDALEFQQKYRDISAEGDVDELMRHYRLVIGMSIMALLHAALMQVPIVSYQPNILRKDDCITNRLGLSRCLTEYEELLEVLSGKNRYQVLADRQEKQPFWLDGNSTERVMESVLDILNGGIT